MKEQTALLETWLSLNVENLTSAKAYRYTLKSATQLDFSLEAIQFIGFWDGHIFIYVVYDAMERNSTAYPILHNVLSICILPHSFIASLCKNNFLPVSPCGLGTSEYSLKKLIISKNTCSAFTVHTNESLESNCNTWKKNKTHIKTPLVNFFLKNTSLYFWLHNLPVNSSSKKPLKILYILKILKQSERELACKGKFWSNNGPTSLASQWFEMQSLIRERKYPDDKIIHAKDHFSLLLW